MNNIWQTTFSGFTGLFGSGRQSNDAVDRAVEELLNRTDPRLRALGGYQRVLRPPMQRAHDYVTDLVGQIPGPIEVCADSFSRDPLVNALFANVDDLHRIYSSSNPLRAFFDAPEHAESDDCLALLCIRRHEKNVFGMEMNGDQLRRDVPQTLVSFDDHQVMTPAEREDELRQGLHRCILDGLMNHAREQLTSGQLRHRKLQDQHRVLSSRIRALERRSKADSDTATAQDLSDTRAKLTGVEKDLANLRQCCGDLGAQLRVLANALDHARDHVRIQHQALRLSRTHVKLDPNRDVDGALLSLAEVKLGDEPPRVVTLTRYPRGEVVSRANMLG